ncbi:MAG: hypothetical protein R3C28_07110 [Pirellulaceae bacterium]
MASNNRVRGKEAIRVSWLIVLLGCLWLPSRLVGGEVIRDDFSDGSLVDGTPIGWRGVVPRQISIDETGLRVSAQGGAILQTSTMNSTGWSMRAQVRRTSGDATGLGSQSTTEFTSGRPSDTWVALFPGGTLQIGTNGTVLGRIDGFDPEVQDVILQLDTFGDELQAWAWLPGSAPNSTVPLLTATRPTLADASAGIWLADNSGADGGFAESTFRWFEYSDEHLSIPVPEPHGLLLLLMAMPSLRWARHAVTNRST